MQVKRRIRKGIPNEVRGLAWQYLSGGRQLMVARPGYYSHLLGSDTEKVGAARHGTALWRGGGWMHIGCCPRDPALHSAHHCPWARPLARACMRSLPTAGWLAGWPAGWLAG